MEPVNHTLGLEIGPISCALRCGDEGVYTRLKSLYANFFTERPADITVELEALDGKSKLTTDEITSALGETRFIHNNNTFRTTTDLMAGWYDMTKPSIRITGDRSLVDPDQEVNHLNRLLCLAYYSACKAKYGGDPPALIVHCCAIVRHGRALVFAGPSGAGKTTIARLCAEKDGEVLNDEMVLITRPSRNGGGIAVQSAPMLGGLGMRQKKSAPLSCIFLLEKGPRTSVRRMEPVEAYLRFLRQVISPAHIGQKDRKVVYNLMADFGKEITQQVPVYEMEFTLDAGSLWKVVGELEAVLERKTP